MYRPSESFFSSMSIGGSLQPPLGGGPNKCLNSSHRVRSFCTSSALPFTVGGPYVGSSEASHNSPSPSSSLSSSNSYSSRPSTMAKSPVPLRVGQPMIKSLLKSFMMRASVTNWSGRGIASCSSSRPSLPVGSADSNSRSSPWGTATLLLTAMDTPPPASPHGTPSFLSCMATFSLTASVLEPLSNVVFKTIVSPPGTSTVSVPCKTVGGALSASLAGSTASLTGSVAMLPSSRLVSSVSSANSVLNMF